MKYIQIKSLEMACLGNILYIEGTCYIFVDFDSSGFEYF